jgi:SSS family transporter
MTPYDYGVIAFYFLFMLVVGALAGRMVANPSDFFRGGGQMVWWLVGASAFMTQFSAWTFTGAASKAYSEGWPIFVIFYANSLGFLLNFFYFAARARQMRVITAVEAVRLRFSKSNEQLFTWLQIPLGTLYAGIWLNGLAVFLSAAFGLPIEPVILVTGIVIVAMTFVGGSWAAVASDFIQVLILMPITVVAAFLALREVGGLPAFVDKLPEGHLDLGRMFDSPLLLLWVVAIVIKQWISINNLLDASRYLCVKDGTHARRAALLATVLFAVGPVIWFITPMAGAILTPDLAAAYPALSNPAEAAFVAVCKITMPAGMIGLLVSGIFAATMSSMDSGLNRNAGIFVKNFYQSVLRPLASERELLLAGRIATAVLGAMVITAALNFARMKDLGLFDLMLQFGTLVAVPYTIPLVLCVIVRRSPPWAGWSTVLVGFVVSFVVTRYFGPAWLQSTFDLAPLDAAERGYWTVAAGLFSVVLVAGAWFFFACRFWPSVPAADRARIEEFNDRMRTPVDFTREMGAGSDFRQGRLLGGLCLAYGAFVALLALLPNPFVGRLGFLFCAAVLAGVGLALRRAARGSSTPGSAGFQPASETSSASPTARETASATTTTR